ncbi:hypothetical protein [Candidatus Poriferisodalis sp.]|uniref:hypothetical protein n=1 Tax=Candidatus Poriferisodalis sp. TaxID=3101277 RepID=UPI003B019ED9
MTVLGRRSERPRGVRLRHAPCRSADSRGLVTLEWLLIVGAVAGLAALSVLVVDRVLEGPTNAATEPVARVIEAEVRAAFIEDAARAAHARAVTNRTVFGVDRQMPYRDQCAAMVEEFADVIDRGRPEWLQVRWSGLADGRLISTSASLDPADLRCRLGYRDEFFR